ALRDYLGVETVIWLGRGLEDDETDGHVDEIACFLAPGRVAALVADDLVIASFVSGPGSSTLPMVVFSKVPLGVSPDINALATIIVLVVSICVATAGWINARREHQCAADARMALQAEKAAA
ncbi:MAG: agmatine deiminase family protein, partial [Azospirillaceae bacterium]